MLSITTWLVPKLCMPLSRPAVTHGLDELFLGQRLQAVDQRRADQAFLVRAVAAVAGGLAPGAEALHRVLVDLVAVDHRVQRRLGVLGEGGGGGEGERPSRSCESSDCLPFVKGDGANGPIPGVRTGPVGPVFALSVRQREDGQRAAQIGVLVQLAVTAHGAQAVGVLLETRGHADAGPATDAENTPMYCLPLCS